MKSALPFQTKEQLQSAVDQNLPAIMERFKVALRPIEKPYSIYRRLSLLAHIGILTSLIFGILFLSDLHHALAMRGSESNLRFLITLCVGTLLVSVLFYILRIPYRTDFVVLSHNMVVVEALSLMQLSNASTVSLVATRAKLSPSTEELQITEDIKKYVFDELDYSELATEAHNTNKLDDVYNFVWNGRQVLVAEMDISHVTGSGKSRNVKQIFVGYFIKVSLDKTINGKVFISAENDAYGFANRRFLFSNKEKSAFDTQLEWGDFEKLLRVTTTDEVVAREVLTPDYMSRLYDWWRPQQDSRTLRIAFIEQAMYAFVPSKRIRVSGALKKLNQEEVRREILAVAEPFLPVLQLLQLR